MSQTQTKWYPIAEPEQFPLRQGKRVVFQDYDVAVFNLGDKFKAIDNVCPHKQGPLADGMVNGETVFCPLHAWQIELGNGCAISGGEGQVKSYPVQVLEGKVCVAFEEGMLKECSEA